MRRHFICILFVALAIARGGVAFGEAPDSGTKPENPLDALRAYRYLEQICAIGPRPTGSKGMAAQQDLLEKHFTELGGDVVRQTFRAPSPLGGEVSLTNLIVRWHPERKKRILLCTHYDTRPLPDRDPDPVRRTSGVFIGANDGASGVAVLMELAHLMGDLEGPYGVDFVFFDGEEFIFVERRDPYFLGSNWFALQYVKNPPDVRYRWGVLLDMVGDRDLQLHQEGFSATWRDTRPLVKQIWDKAEELGVEEFIPRIGMDIRDDHLPLHNVAKIPTCNIIDLNYPYWHTEQDVPKNCSPTSLAKVGWVVYEWLKSLEP